MAMNIKASGRSALIIATGLWLGFAGPMHATSSAAEPAGAASQAVNAAAALKPGARHHKRHARKHKPAKPEIKSDANVHETADAKEATAIAGQDSGKHMPLPPTVANANANAEMPGAIEDTPKTEASALASSAGQMLSGNQNDSAPQADNANAAAAANIVSPDELNEIDRALADEEKATPHLALASIDIAPSASNDNTNAQTASGDTTWNNTSLIGKIFIAFGGLLMLGSVARMLIA
jgi:hypothetical protein